MRPLPRGSSIRANDRALVEPIDGRIIEVSNDDRNIFVPVAKGREIVTTGGMLRVRNEVVRKRRTPLMRLFVANLTDRDMVAITADLASLPVKTSRPLTQPLGNATR